jgi:phosphonate transport system substrate-binding protein
VSEAPLEIGAVLAPASARPDDGSLEILRARLQAFADALGDASGTPTAPSDFDDYPSLLEALYAGKVDVAWLPPLVAMRAAGGGRALPIALPVRRGISSFHSALFSLGGSPIVRPPDLVGLRAAWVDRQSASGFLVVRAALRAQGVDLATAFREESFLGSHDAVAEAVLTGAADVGATYLHHDARGSGVWRAGWGTTNVNVVARVGPIPNDVIAAGVHVPVARIKLVRQALVDGAHPGLVNAARELMQADEFTTVESEHLKPLEDLLDFLEDRARPWRRSSPPPSR